ncbi:hypothetical protein BJ742DRAFT_767322 [Cladochytrium replicatum]|nr:hypothetical protein BJ742DRAFT_767322 [Cladochytrium replicatum]
MSAGGSLEAARRIARGHTDIVINWAGSDRLGCFNLSIRGHGACLAFAKSLGIQMMVLGWRGYTIRNVARCWTHGTRSGDGRRDPAQAPRPRSLLDHYAPDFFAPPADVKPGWGNQNSRSYLTP